MENGRNTRHRAMGRGFQSWMKCVALCVLLPLALIVLFVTLTDVWSAGAHGASVAEAVRASSMTCAGVYHIVRPGETIYSIAARYGSTAYRIKVCNGLRSYRVYVGQGLRVPTRYSIYGSG